MYIYMYIYIHIHMHIHLHLDVKCIQVSQSDFCPLFRMLLAI